MLMEPDEHTDVHIVPAETRVLYSGIVHPRSLQSGFRPYIPNYSPISRSAPESLPESIPATAEQNYFPAFFRNAPPLGHSRPYYPQPEQPKNLPRLAPPPLPPITTTQESSSPRYNAGRNNNWDQSILGSGDFGVIRGGTFYQDNDPPIKGGEEDYYGGGSTNYYNNNNGHGRPHAAPLVQKLTYPDEQFANFRDFADINTPNDPAYSQFVVVYANKNSSIHHTRPAHLIKNPKNIFEQLQLIDRSKNINNNQNTNDDDSFLDILHVGPGDESEKKPKNKLSKFKTKLSKNKKIEKKYNKKLGPKDNNDYEPLLALS